MPKIDELRKKVEEAAMSAEAKKECERELKRLAKMTPASAEYMVSRTYLEWMTSLAVEQVFRRGGHQHRQGAETILDEDHYDLEKVKERILDYLAVKKLQPGMKGPILCFVGTSGRGQDFARKIDCACAGTQVRAHRSRRHARRSGNPRTSPDVHRRAAGPDYSGPEARAKRNDPVCMLDEVDKLGRDFRGDPSSALMEVLDPEQNNAFRDHYLDVPFDLSKVLFIATANWMDPIPEPLRDRMESHRAARVYG